MTNYSDLPVEVLQLVYSFCDVDTLIVTACTNRHNLHISTRELRKRGESHVNFDKRLHEALATFLSTHRGNLVIYRPYLCRSLGYKIHTWKALAEQPPSLLNRYLRDHLISYELVAQDFFCAKPMPPMTSVRALPSLILYKLWQCAFMGKGQVASVTESKPRAKIYDNKRLLFILTDEVMTLFREQLVINDKFLLICFEQKLDGILIYLHENSRFFNLDISAPSLTDMYLMLACDTSSSNIFLRFVSHVKRPHLEYALRHATADFLMILWKSRKYMPRWADEISTICSDFDHPIYLRDYKQRQFLDWCVSHP